MRSGIGLHAVRLVLTPLLILAFAAGGLLSPAFADNTFQCQGGQNTAITNACGARWEAANIRAHIAARKYGGYTPACLERTARVLEQRASAWISKNKYRPFEGPWPCGVEPWTAKADDGALAKACPGSAWSYDNRGVVNCLAVAAARKPRRVAAHVPSTPEPTPSPDPPSVISARLASALSGDWRYNFEAGGHGNVGSLHTTVQLSDCHFNIASNDANVGGHFDSHWTGNLGDVDPDSVREWRDRLYNFWQLGFRSARTASTFTYDGFIYADSAWGEPAAYYGTSGVAIRLGFDPASLVADLRSLVSSCSTRAT